MYEYEKYDRQLIITSDTIKSTNYVTMNKALNDKWFISSTSYIQFDISNPKMYRLLNISQIALSATDRIDIAFNFDTRYDTKPVLDQLSKSFFDFSIGLRYNF
jgi:hypothetical protein